MKLYAAYDLHANNSYDVIIDETRNRVIKQRLPNNPVVILEHLKPHKKKITKIVVESPYNWHWLVDQLSAKDYRLLLTNTTATNTQTMPYGWRRFNISPDGFIYTLKKNIPLETFCEKGYIW